MFGLGPTELIVIAIIILFFFGAKRLPEIGQGLGKAISEFRKVKKEFQKEKINSEKGDSPSDAAGALEEKASKEVLEKAQEVKDRQG
jgi:sec-independent protein translocase protein TatA